MFAFAEDNNNLKEQVSFMEQNHNVSMLGLYCIQNVSSSQEELLVVQIFVHCDVVICDLKKRETGACNRQCPRPENKFKGMAQVQKFFR